MNNNYKKNSLNLITLGCSKNTVDSEKLLAQFSGQGWEVSHDSNEPTEVVVINTCGFIADAKEESVETILEWADAKSRGLIRKLVVFGCLTQRYQQDIQAEIPEIDHILGVNDPKAVLNSLNADLRKELISERYLTAEKHYAYLKISEGCNRKCSFCAIPFIRGKHFSTPIEELVAETKSLVGKGVKEILLIAQDLSSYGIDLYKKPQLGRLLEELSEIDGLKWIRLHYAYPAGFPEDVIDIMASNPKVCNYLDIPFQHASDPVLKSMMRGHSSMDNYELIEKLRAKVPDIAIRTTMITGYPGETEENFDELMKFVGEVKFERLGVFTYSEEDGTSAADLEDDVPEDVKQLRSDELMKLQHDISLENNQSFIGKSIEVIIDRKEGDDYIGRSQYDSPEVDNEVIISTEKELTIGEFYEVKVTDADYFDLIAEY